MSRRNWNTVLTGLLLAPIPFVARAETYLSEEQAVAVLFPGLKMEAQVMQLSKEELRKIHKESRDRFLKPQVKAYWGPGGEALFIDRVLGKHEFITYAAAFHPDGSIKGLEILDYRETYGYQVRDKSWRDRFKGKTRNDSVRLDADIPNISGATLSSVHLTNGMHRLLRAYDFLRAHR